GLLSAAAGLNAGSFCVVPHKADIRPSFLSLTKMAASWLSRQANPVSAQGCPAIGCGVRGFPPAVAARAGLQCLAPEVCPRPGPPYVEVRFWDHNVLSAWTTEAMVHRQLEECQELEVREELWQGGTLASWTEKRQVWPCRIC
ncbi:unnamed protein product, partial [Effrenium voratum]